MKKLLSLLTAASLTTGASSATISCGGASSTSLKITEGKAGTKLETNLESDFNNSDSSDAKTTIINDIANGTIVISGYEFLPEADGTPRVTFFSNSDLKNVSLQADATIHISVTTKEAIGKIAAGTYNGNFIVSKTSLSSFDTINFKIGLNVYDQVRTQLGAFAGISADDVATDGVGIAVWQDGGTAPLAQDAVVEAGQTYIVKINTESSMYFTGGEKTINVPISKVNLDVIKTINLAVGDDIYNAVRTQLGEYAGVDAQGIKDDSVVIAIYNDKGGLDDGAKVMSGENYTIKLIANTSKYFTGDENDINVPVSKVNLDTVNLTLSIGNNIYNDVRTQLATLVGGQASDIEADGIGIAIWEDGGTEPLAQDATVMVGKVYTVKLVATDSMYFTGTEKDITVTMPKIGIDTVNLTLTVNNPMYDEVRSQLATLVGGQASDIQNDGIGIAIWEDGGTEPLAQDALTAAGKTYTVKLVVNDSMYFSGTEKDITITTE